MVTRKDDEWLSHEFKEVTFYIIFGIVVSIILPIIIGFYLTAFEESFVPGKPIAFGDLLTTYMIYYIFILAGLIGLPTLKIREMFITKKKEHPANQSDPSLISVGYLHDPEQDGALYNLFNWIGLKKNPMKWSLSILRCFIIGTIIFGGLGITQLLFGIEFTGIPQISMQVTPASEVYLTAEPASFGETNLVLLIFCLLMGVNAWICSKLGLTKAGYFFIGIFIVCSLIGFAWMGLHKIIYQNSEAKLWATFIFGFLGSLITLLTGTFIFWWTFHFWNNIFVKLGTMTFAQEDIMFVSLAIWVGLIVIYGTIEFLIWRFKKRKSMEVMVPV